MAGLLTRAAILAASDLPTRDVEVPEWGGTVRVRTMMARDRDVFDMALREAAKAGVGTNVRAYFAATCIIGDDGEPLFTADDVEALGAKSSEAMNRVYDAIVDLNRLAASAVADAAKNSSADRSGGSSSGSPATSAKRSASSKPS